MSQIRVILIVTGLSARARFERADGGRLLGVGPRKIWTWKGNGYLQSF